MATGTVTTAAARGFALGRISGVAVTVATVWVLAACQNSPKPIGRATPPRGVVLVLVDALRADHLGFAGYDRRTSPRLDQLAADATIFRNAVTTAPWTLPAMGSLWTGLYPTVHGATRRSSEFKLLTDPQKFRPVSVLSPERTTLAEVLQRNQFRTVAFVDGAYAGSIFGFAQGFDRFVEAGVEGARMNVQGFLDWLDQSAPDRFFAYIHLVDVHSPYTGPAPPAAVMQGLDAASARQREEWAEEQQRYRAVDFNPGYRGKVDGSQASLAMIRGADPAPASEDLRQLIALYDRGIAYADHWIGELIDGLRSRGLYDQSIVIVTADHGEEFLEHGALEHGVHFYEEVMRIPLVIRVPGLGHGLRIEEQVSLIDIVPTVLNVLGLQIPAGLHGLSLLPLFSGVPVAPDRLLFGEADQGVGEKAMRTNQIKLIKKGKRYRLYDLRADPQERVNLCAEPSPDCEALAQMFAEWESAMTASAQNVPTPGSATIDEQTQERLKSLGYE